MDKSDKPDSRKKMFWTTILKNLLFYGLVPLLLLRLFAQPIRSAVCLSDPAAFWILLAFLGAVGLNWFVYTVVHQKRPSLLVFAHGVFFLLVADIIQYTALPGSYPLVSTLAIIGGSLALAFLFLLSFWFASRASRPAHAAAVGIWIVIGLLSCAMAYRVIRDIESHLVSRDTWITITTLIGVILAYCIRKIRSIIRRSAFRRRAAGLAMGRIVQIIGETHLDRDDDLVTRNYVRVQYTVNSVLLETRADISRYTVRRYGKEAFIGRAVPVYYDPADPKAAYVNRIDKQILDQRHDKAS